MSTSPRVQLQTNQGTILIELNAEKAPNTVANFVDYVSSGFYDGTVFHRVINNFMIQGGGFEADMKQKATNAPVKNEADNGLKNDKYTLAMARTSDPHSATAQFFINVADNDFLNFTAPTANGWGYAVFGRVIEGMDVVDKIKTVRTGNKGFHQDVPVEDVVLEKSHACRISSRLRATSGLPRTCIWVRTIQTPSRISCSFCIPPSIKFMP